MYDLFRKKNSKIVKLSNDFDNTNNEKIIQCIICSSCDFNTLDELYSHQLTNHINNNVFSK